MKYKNYLVTLDIFLMEHVSVEARTKKEAIKEAMKASRFIGAEGAEAKVFEVELDD